MSSRLFLTLCLALLGVFASKAFADTCLGYPFSIEEKYCGGSFPCPYGQYCDETATCVSQKDLGSSCTSDDQCSSASCRGPSNDARICVSISGPGEPCTYTNEAKPTCGSGYSCNVTSNVCFNGRFGDGCVTDLDCFSGKCSGGTCDGSVGVDCDGNEYCSPDNYCSNNGKCTARLAAGSQCFGDECVADTYCILTEYQSEKNNTCVAAKTLAPGAYCDGTPEVCSSELQSEGYCITKSPSYCSSQDDCVLSQGMFCTCGKDYLFVGAGKCAKISCFKQYKEFLDCAKGCGANSDPEQLFISKSCISLQCKAKADALLKCSPLFGLLFFSGPNK